jgi:hypothetical protein
MLCGFEMTISLRIDVDNPFGYATLWKKTLNKMSLDYDLVPRSERLGYLRPAREMREYLDQKDVSATWFFRNITAPRGKTLRELSAGRHELALHAERSETFEAFHNELKEWAARFGIKPAGFSKHGSGEMKLSRKHDKDYSPERLIEYGKKMRLRYFSGNGTQFDSWFENRDGFVYIPGAYWLDNPSLHSPEVTVDSVVKQSHDMHIVALIHPIWWVAKASVREDLESLLNQTTPTTLKEQIDLFLQERSVD